MYNDTVGFLHGTLQEKYDWLDPPSKHMAHVDEVNNPQVARCYGKIVAK